MMTVPPLTSAPELGLWPPLAVSFVASAGINVVCSATASKRVTFGLGTIIMI